MSNLTYVSKKAIFQAGKDMSGVHAFLLMTFFFRNTPLYTTESKFVERISCFNDSAYKTKTLEGVKKDCRETLHKENDVFFKVNYGSSTMSVMTESMEALLKEINDKKEWVDLLSTEAQAYFVAGLACGLLKLIFVPGEGLEDSLKTVLFRLRLFKHYKNSVFVGNNPFRQLEINLSHMVLDEAEKQGLFLFPQEKEFLLSWTEGKKLEEILCFNNMLKRKFKDFYEIDSDKTKNCPTYSLIAEKIKFIEKNPTLFLDMFPDEDSAAQLLNQTPGSGKMLITIHKDTMSSNPSPDSKTDGWAKRLKWNCSLQESPPIDITGRVNLATLFKFLQSSGLNVNIWVDGDTWGKDLMDDSSQTPRAYDVALNNLIKDYFAPLLSDSRRMKGIEKKKGRKTNLKSDFEEFIGKSIRNAVFTWDSGEKVRSSAKKLGRRKKRKIRCEAASSQ